MGLVTVGLDGYWNSQQGFTSQWKDLSGKGRDGTVIGGVSRSASGLTFNGVDSRVRLTLPTIYESATQPYTLEFWFRLDGAGAYGDPLTLFSSDNGVSSPNEIFYSADPDAGYLRHVAYPGSKISTMLAVNNDKQLTTHIALTFSGSAYSTYRNGVLVRTYSTTPSLPLRKGGTFVVGGTERGGVLSYGWKGILDCIRVYNRQLGASEVMENYNLGMNLGISSDLQAAIQTHSRVTAEFENTSGIAAQVQSSATAAADLFVAMALEASAAATMNAVAGLNLANAAGAAAGESGASAALDVAVGPGVAMVELAASAGGQSDASGYFYMAIVVNAVARATMSGLLSVDRPLAASAAAKLTTGVHISCGISVSGSSVASSGVTGALAESIWKKTELGFGRWRTV